MVNFKKINRKDVSLDGKVLISTITDSQGYETMVFPKEDTGGFKLEEIDSIRAQNPIKILKFHKKILELYNGFHKNREEIYNSF